MDLKNTSHFVRCCIELLAQKLYHNRVTKAVEALLFPFILQLELLDF